MKILALDIGDVWVGSALSDPMGIIARPYKTVTAHELTSFLRTVLSQERIGTVVVGHPKTMKGTISDQTQKIEATFKELETLFADKKWVLWDERLSSKRADSLKHAKTKEEKIQSHSVAAAFILESYLSYLQTQREME
jgi:putative Holliday junction resolvase